MLRQSDYAKSTDVRALEMVDVPEQGNICRHCQLPMLVCSTIALYQRSHAFMTRGRSKLAAQYAEQADQAHKRYMATITT